MKQAVGMNIRTARLACGLTQEDLAERINRTAETVSNIERGRNPPSLETLHDIAATLKVSLDALVMGASREIPVSRLRQEAALAEMIRTMDEADLPTAIQLLDALIQRGRVKS